MNPQPPIGLIACEVFKSEIELLTPNAARIAATDYREIGLHDRPDEMRAALQDAIGRMDRRDDINTIVLAYGLCGCGTAGLYATRHPLVIPRAHDCIAVFLGSKELHAERLKSCPGCYHYTPGWNRARRVPGPERIAALREEFSRKYDPDDVEFLLENEQVMWAAYDTSTFIDLGTPEAAAEAEYTRKCAESLGWKYEYLKGDPAWLRDLLCGPWDDHRFQIIPPGCRLAHSPDESVMRAEPDTPPA